MAQDNNRGQQNQNEPEGFQDPNEQESRQIRSSSSDAGQQSSQGGSVGPDEISDSELELEDLDDLDDEDRDDDQREGGLNRRRSIR
jgi:hypothetical protein